MDTRHQVASGRRAGFGDTVLDRHWPAAAGAATPSLQAVTRVFRLEQGLHALSIGPLGPVAAAGAGVTMPCMQFVSLPSTELDAVDILTAWNDQGAWLTAEGGTVVVRVPPGGGQVLATLYDVSAVEAGVLDDFVIERIDRQHSPGQSAPELGMPARANRPRLEQPGATGRALEVPPMMPLPPEAWGAARPFNDIEIEVALHIEQLGDATFPGSTWCGNIGQKLQVEAFGIRCIDPMAEVQFEYMAYGPAGRETRWITEGKLCGTRGRGIPLTGFAIRVASHLAERYDVTYQGAFIESGVTLPASNGAPCLPPLSDDCLEAVHVRVTERPA